MLLSWHAQALRKALRLISFFGEFLFPKHRLLGGQLDSWRACEAQELAFSRTGPQEGTWHPVPMVVIHAGKAQHSFSLRCFLNV